MSYLRRLIDRLSYANVVATIALGLSLGGVSYAAVTLPAHSVGPRELAPEAVTRSALGFPLGGEGVTDPGAEHLYKGPCNSPPPPGTPIVRCPHKIASPHLRRRPCPLVLEPTKDLRIERPGRELLVPVRSKGRLVVSVIANLRNEGPPGTTADVGMGVGVDGCPAASSELTLDGAHSAPLPVQFFHRAAPGLHKISVGLSAYYSSYQPGEVVVSPVSLIAAVLPPP